MRGIGKGNGWLCLPPGVLRKIGIALAVVGGVLVVVFVPLRYWMALIGVMLLIIGISILLVY